MKRLITLFIALCLPASALADAAEQVQAPERLTLAPHRNQHGHDFFHH